MNHFVTVIGFANCIAVKTSLNRWFVTAIKENIVATHRMYDSENKVWVVWKPYTEDAQTIIENYFTVGDFFSMAGTYVTYPLGAQFDYDGTDVGYVPWAVAFQKYTAEDRRRRSGEYRRTYEDAKSEQRRTYEHYRSYEEAFSGYSRGGQTLTVSRSVRTARSVLYVTEDAPIEVVNAAYRALAKKYHPDTGNGDHEAMLRLNEAYKKIIGT